MDTIRNIAAVLGVIMSASSVAALASKSVRGAVVRFFRRYGHTDEVSDSIGEIKELLRFHIDEDKKFKAEVTATNDIMMEFARAQCRTVIKNIFYKYKDSRTLPLYEKKTLMCVEELYIERLHGNSFAMLMLDEMSHWDVDYDSASPDDR